MNHLNKNHDMALRGRIGGFTKASKYKPTELTSSARIAFLKRFEPTDPTLSEEERQRRTNCALKAYMAKLARNSALSRKKHSNK